MKNRLLVLLAFASIGFVAGCGDSDPQATAQDKANLDRLSREGMSPPASAPKVNEKGGAPGNPQPTGQIPPP